MEKTVFRHLSRAIILLLCFLLVSLCAAEVLAGPEINDIRYSEPPLVGDRSQLHLVGFPLGGAVGGQFAFDRLRPRTSDADQAAAVRALIGRLVPDRAAEIQLDVDRGLLDNAGRDKFIAIATDGVLHILASTGVAAAWGFLHYLKYACRAHVSWDADQLSLPQPLPPGNFSVRANDRFRYYQNVCTVSYSSVWWDWQRWQRQLDWMALNGVNLALAFSGQEVLWRRVFTRLGLTEHELDDYFTGPAFLAWNRMGNLKRWGGGLSASWHAQQLTLAHQIVARMRELGITPVLPAFAGHVPDNFTRVFPDAPVSRQRCWGHMNATYSCNLLLDPTSALYRRVGTAFVRELETEFNGTEHVYNCDSFNEMTPPSGEADYLRAAGNATLQAMADADTDAVWLMQGWLFLSQFWTPERVQAYVTSVPIGRMIVLDLSAEHRPVYIRAESFFGQPFIWCMLHNFGGQLGMHGPLQSVLTDPFAGRAFPNSSMVGTGLTMEGIFQNYVIYDLMLEMGWRIEPPEPLQWAADYGARRYGPISDVTPLSHAWRLLITSVYNGTGTRPGTGALTWTGPYVFTNRPSLHTQPQRWFRLKDLAAAWDLLASAGAADVRASATLRHDLADVTREVISQLAAEYHRQQVAAFQRRDSLLVQELGTVIMECYGDLDTVLNTADNFLLGRWLRDAAARASSHQERQQLLYNARNQVTLWGPTGEIADYAAKQWAGLLANFYQPRWHVFTAYLDECLAHNVSFSQTEANRRYLERVERPFTFANTTYPHLAAGDTYTAVQTAYRKYRPALAQYLTRPRPTPVVFDVRVHPLLTSGAGRRQRQTSAGSRPRPQIQLL